MKTKRKYSSNSSFRSTASTLRTSFLTQLRYIFRLFYADYRTESNTKHPQTRFCPAVHQATFCDVITQYAIAYCHVPPTHLCSPLLHTGLNTGRCKTADAQSQDSGIQAALEAPLGYFESSVAVACWPRACHRFASLCWRLRKRCRIRCLS